MSLPNSSQAQAIDDYTNVNSVQYSGNVAYDWLPTNSPFYTPGPFSDSSRSVETYDAFLGGPGTFNDFNLHVRAQSRDNWRQEYTADAVNDYIRAGFDMATVGSFTPPLLSNIASSTSATTATITWTTDAYSTSSVAYGTTTGYGSTSSSAASVISHSITITGLTSNTLYHYRIGSQGASGDVTMTWDYTFKTTAAADITPPVISLVASSTTATTPPPASPMEQRLAMAVRRHRVPSSRPTPSRLPD